ncbi:AAA family ATPase [soil metagenome]
MESFLARFQAEAGQVLIDRSRELELALCCFVSGGNLLIEDTPGVGKTTLVKVMARLLGLDFKRVQFTNDLLPADILGSQVFDSAHQTFSFHRGPIFAQLVLGDELNRASPRTQSAVLQAMDEHEVTIEGQTYPLPSPFFFAGTQNPHDQVGTALLPESQTDRFLMRIALGAPERDTQRKLLAKHRGRAGNLAFDFQALNVLVKPEELLTWQSDAANVHVAEAVSEYILDLFEGARSRSWELSPRASLGLQRAAQSRAFLNGREHALPDDVQAVFLPVVTHRLARFARVPGDAREAAVMARSLLEQTKAR